MEKDLASPLSEMLSTIVLVIIIWIGGNIVLNENFDAESFIGYLLVFSQILPPAKSLTSAFYSIQKELLLLTGFLKFYYQIKLSEQV